MLQPLHCAVCRFDQISEQFMHHLNFSSSILDVGLHVFHRETFHTMWWDASCNKQMTGKHSSMSLDDLGGSYLNIEMNDNLIHAIICLLSFNINIICQTFKLFYFLDAL